MFIKESSLPDLATALRSERKRQKLSREQAAAVCGVSSSFIRDAESDLQNCTLGKMVRLVNGLGMRLQINGLEKLPDEAWQKVIGKADVGMDS
jgi:HTH-type transcriptional regulator/antitoxin HipB